MKKRGIIWFRQDLRLHDNEAINEGTKVCDELLYVYIFDQRTFEGKTSFGLDKTGEVRANFIRDCVEDLRVSIEKRGGKLMIKQGIPEDILFKLAQEYKTSWVFCNRERTSEEVEVQDALEQKLWSIGQEVRYSRGKMLFYTSDLPFPITQTPDLFITFRKEVEKITPIREPLEIPEELKSLHFENEGKLENVAKERNCLIGGETAGLKRLEDFISGQYDSTSSSENEQGELQDSIVTSGFSPYLAQGCLSPKLIYHEILKIEEKRGSIETLHSVYYELLWRDFFRLMGKKHGNHIFQLLGYNESIPEVADDIEKRSYDRWKTGTTGTPFVDAFMRKLNRTGLLSNRGRQIVASYLIHDLKLNWILGAEYFESMLLDYDPTSNYGNWAYMAGVGSDTRKDRHFNIMFQSKKYDPDGIFIKYWIEELRDLDGKDVHAPDQLEQAEQNKIKGSRINYNSPLVASEVWLH